MRNEFAKPSAVQQVTAIGTPKLSLVSVYVAVSSCAIVSVLMVAANEDFRHWFVLPVFACGAIVGTDAVDWLRGRTDTFDPVGIVGLFGVHFFFVAPLLHVQWDYWLWTSRWSAYLPPPVDWRPWLGVLATINFVGLVIYSLIWRGIATRYRSPKRTSTWRIADDRFIPLLASALLCTAAAQFAVYQSSGGIGGYVAAYESRSDWFRGLGPLFMITESFPILMVFGVAWFGARHRWARSWHVVVCLLVVFFAVQILFGGLRGSRSNTIWGLFWAVGIVHFWLRPVPRKLVTFGLVALFGFMYLYGFYKSAGLEALRGLGGGEAFARLERETGRTVERLLLADLGRSDVQAYALYATSHSESNYELSWGRTYVAALTIIIPRWIWPGRPERKIKEGTEIILGTGSYQAGRRYSSRVYGMVGEWSLNFPYALAPATFGLLGLGVAYVRIFGLNLRGFDARLLLLPFLINLCFIVLSSDSDNIVFFLFKRGALPVAVVALGSVRSQPGESR